MTNILFDHILTYEYSARIGDYDRRCVYFTLSNFTRSEFHGSLQEESTSWRRMLVFQPHAAPCYIVTRGQHSEQSSLEEGLTMNELLNSANTGSFWPLSDDVEVYIDFHAGLELSERYDHHQYQKMVEKRRIPLLDLVCGHDILKIGTRYNMK